MHSRLPLMLAALITFLLHMGSAHAIVNGETADAEQYRAIVSLGGCTGTFIHPRFIVTAAHCIKRCRVSGETGCVTGSPREVMLGTAYGKDGPVSMTARDGIVPGTGNIYPIDHVYFARAIDLNRSRPADVAILRTTLWFSGQLIPAFPAQDLPHADESYYCKRWEFTWPWVAGYSGNAGADTRARRIGRAFAECDLEFDQTAFKLDGHGREGQKGIRICKGDSGGPVLWESGYGGFVVGGINSGTDNYDVITDTQCPSEKGEGYHAFIPAALLDRVSASDAICQGESQWRRCPGVPLPYGGRNAKYLGTEIDQCGEQSLKVAGLSTVTLAPGETREVVVPDNEFDWTCGNTDESTAASGATEYLITKRALTDRQIIWDTYRIDKPDPDGHKQPWLIDALDDDYRPAVAMSVNGVDHDMVENVGGYFNRTYSPDSATTWFIPSLPGTGEFPTPDSQIGNGVFISAPAAAVSSNGLRLHVVGRGTDSQFYHAMSEDGGSSWVVAWQPFEGISFKSAPAIATTADGSELHVVGLGLDNHIWIGKYLIGTHPANIWWEPLGDQWTFVTAPAIAMSADGKSRYVFGVGTDSRMYFTKMATGTVPPTASYTQLPAGVFTSGPAAVTRSDGLEVHVFGVGTDSRIWRAFSPDGGKSWRIAWLPIGAGVFSSGPAAALSGDGKHLHVFGRGVPPTDFAESFEPSPRVWRAFSGDGGVNWALAWGEIVPLPD